MFVGPRRVLHTSARATAAPRGHRRRQGCADSRRTQRFNSWGHTRATNPIHARGISQNSQANWQSTRHQKRSQRPHWISTPLRLSQKSTVLRVICTAPISSDVARISEGNFRALKKIEADDEAQGRYKLTGDLTMREVTKPISFPATLRVTDAVTLTSRFKIKRERIRNDLWTGPRGRRSRPSVAVGRPTPKITPQ